MSNMRRKKYSIHSDVHWILGFLDLCNIPDLSLIQSVPLNNHSKVVLLCSPIYLHSLALPIAFRLVPETLTTNCRLPEERIVMSRTSTYPIKYTSSQCLQKLFSCCSWLSIGDAAALKKYYIIYILIRSEVLNTLL